MNSIPILYSIIGAAESTLESAWIRQTAEAMHIISVLIGIIGVAVIVWGVLCGLLRLVKMEVSVFRGHAVEADREALKEHLGFYLLLGLEFLVAADIIETMLAPTLDHLIVLAGIVAIRTVISVSLNWELASKARKS